VPGAASFVAMLYRPLGRTGFDISTVSFGAWAIGGTWGPADDAESLAALHRALDRGVNFFDTADVYGDGRSERLLARLRRERPGDRFVVATKAGKRLKPFTVAGFNRDTLGAFVERSLINLEVEALDLLQLHCPPPGIYDRPEVFGALDDLVRAGKIRYYGVSVQKIDEALAAIEYPAVQSIQIIYNMFRQRPAEALFAETRRRGVGILARLPLSSGMLAGKMTPSTSFSGDDHRQFNRQGEAFDMGETFSGIPYEQGLAAVEALRPLVPPGMTMATFALRWILMEQGVTAAIPGARRPSQVDENVSAADLPPLSAESMTAVRALYDQRLRPLVHHRW
jgi:aryl-alcohol dehydrogenase-like predicted oxidoreductase